MRRLVPVVAVALVAASFALAQGFGVTVEPDDAYVTYHLGPYNGTTGALMDAGYSTNSLGTNAYPLSIEGGQALVAAECEARMLRDGINNKRSNIISIDDERANGSRKVHKVILTVAAVDAGALVNQSGNPAMAMFWRPLSGGDAGMPWQQVRGASFGVVAAASAGAPNTGLFMNAFTIDRGNGSVQTSANADAWVPGYYCFLPASASGYGVSHLWFRVNRVLGQRY